MANPPLGPPSGSTSLSSAASATPLPPHHHYHHHVGHHHHHHHNHHLKHAAAQRCKECRWQRQERIWPRTGVQLSPFQTSLRRSRPFCSSRRHRTGRWLLPSPTGKTLSVLVQPQPSKLRSRPVLLDLVETLFTILDDNPRRNLPENFLQSVIDLAPRFLGLPCLSANPSIRPVSCLG